MIYTEVFFAETNRSYDFKLETDVPVHSLVEDMVSMITQWDHLTLRRDPGLFLLCRQKDEMVLDPAVSLTENGVRSGDSLLLV